jgi:hypothetical protein
MANNENFKTIVYEEGHAVFEQVSGGENMVFATAMKDYVLTSRYDAETGYSAMELAMYGTIARRLEALETKIAALEGIFPATAEVGQYLKVSAVDENGKITALEAVSQAEYKLPYTAAELVEKLSAIGNETVSDGGEADGN